MTVSVTWLGIYTVSIKNTLKSWGIFSFRLLWEYRHYKYCPALCFYSRCYWRLSNSTFHYLAPIKKGGDTILSWIGNFFYKHELPWGESRFVCNDGTFTMRGKKDDDAAELKKKKQQNSKDWLFSFASIPYFITKTCMLKVCRCTIHWTL
jgi:hypothetical protein